jgi:hypothetical protein
MFRLMEIDQGGSWSLSRDEETNAILNTEGELTVIPKLATTSSAS